MPEVRKLWSELTFEELEDIFVESGAMGKGGYMIVDDNGLLRDKDERYRMEMIARTYYVKGKRNDI